MTDRRHTEGSGAESREQSPAARRHVLELLGAAGVATLSGCSAIGTDDVPILGEAGSKDPDDAGPSALTDVLEAEARLREEARQDTTPRQIAATEREVQVGENASLRVKPLDDRSDVAAFGIPVLMTPQTVLEQTLALFGVSPRDRYGTVQLGDRELRLRGGRGTRLSAAAGILQRNRVTVLLIRGDTPTALDRAVNELDPETVRSL